MVAKLALRNVHRALRDYAIYFVTLVLGVALFYAINSVSSQSILFDFHNDLFKQMFVMTGQLLGLFSVVVVFVLGFLVLYANGFLIRRRKQEFGTYLMLGMHPTKVASILLIETGIVGIVSLAVGLALGYFMSQGLSFVTAALFSVTMSQYHFIFSLQAFLATLGCFALIFLLTALYNCLCIRRYKLINLLSAASKTTRLRVRNPWISLAAFIVALGLLAGAYALLIDDGMVQLDTEFWWSCALMVAGTFLLFWSAAGFVLCIVERNHRMYFKGLRPFTLRQIASKVNTAFISLSLVSILLFFALTVLSVGMGLEHLYGVNLKGNTPFDATLTAVTSDFNAPSSSSYDDTSEQSSVSSDNESQVSINAQRQAEKNDWAAYGGNLAEKLKAGSPLYQQLVSSSVQLDVYASNDLSYGTLLDRYGVDSGNKEQSKALHTSKVKLIAVSQFNKLCDALGHKEVSVGNTGYLVNNTISGFQVLSDKLSQKGETLTIDGHELRATGQECSQELWDTVAASQGANIIVPDAIIADLRAQGVFPEESYFNCFYTTDRTHGDALLDQMLTQVSPPQSDSANTQVQKPSFTAKSWPLTYSLSATEVYIQQGGITMLISYLALYLGFVFLIATAAILAIQQLCATSDSLSRYRLLAQIGCDRRLLFRSLRIQTLMYFMAPLVVAAAHTICAVGVVNKAVLQVFTSSILEPVFLTVALMALVYGIYLWVTYAISKGIIRTFLSKLR